MKYFNKINDLPILSLHDEYLQLLSKKIIKQKDGQVCINSIKGQEHDTTFGVGSLLYDWSKSNTNTQGQLNVPLREVPLQEQDFTELCDPFKNTIFEELFLILNKKYKLGRVRIMESDSKTCLTWHKDTSTRLHYPIKTQQGCFMVIQDEVFHIPQNEWWHTNTKVLHTAFNGSKETRLHLVVAIND